MSKKNNKYNYGVEICISTMGKDIRQYPCHENYFINKTQNKNYIIHIFVYRKIVGGDFFNSDSDNRECVYFYNDADYDGKNVKNTEYNLSLINKEFDNFINYLTQKDLKKYYDDGFKNHGETEFMNDFLKWCKDGGLK